MGAARLGKLGWVAAFLYCAGAALRLARFNTMLDVADKRWFTGIPSPAAAALVAGFIWFIDDYDIDPQSVRWWALFVTVFAGLTMVSNLKYYSFKAINLRKSVPFFVVLAAAVVVGLAALQPPLVLFGVFVAYAISGYVVSAYLRMRRRRSGRSRDCRCSRGPRMPPRPARHRLMRRSLFVVCGMSSIASRADGARRTMGVSRRRRQGGPLYRASFWLLS